jgi:serine/threonine-protein kinase
MLTGELIADRYRLTRRLGNGGMGVVWAARNEAIARDVAIKVMLPRIAEDPVALQRFFNEARICGSIRHPGIVDVLDLGRADDGSPFLVMELLEGETLGERLERVKGMPPGVILAIVRDIARTIAMAHKRGIIHRDIKPSNIFLHRMATGEEIVKVLDFGISKVLSPEFETHATRTGAVLGSPAYMAPERIKGDEIAAPQTDVYALGVILYEGLAGRPPYLAQNYNALIVDIATTDPDDIAALVPGLPPAVAALVRHAMARDPSARIATMDEFADRIEHILYGLQSGDSRYLIADPVSAPLGSRLSRPSFPGAPASVPSPTLQSAPSLVKTGGGVTTSGELYFEPRRRNVPLLIAGLGLGAGVVIAIFVLMAGGDPSASTAGSPEGTAPTSSAASTPSVSPAAEVPAQAATATPTPSTTASALAAKPGASAAPTSPPPKSTARPPTSKTGKPPTKQPGGAWSYD